MENKEVEFPIVEELQDVIMQFLTQNTINGNICFVKDNETIIALVNKESLNNKEHMLTLFHLVRQQITYLIGEEKCKKVIKLPGQQ